MHLPEFATPLARAQVEQLMQPALIRVIDNIRKQLEVSDWQGSYEEELIWPVGTTAEQQQAYTTLQKQLHGVPPEEHDRVAALMSQLPQPSPLYRLKLLPAKSTGLVNGPAEPVTEPAVEKVVDIWALCYQVCAIAYDPEEADDSPIEADNSLLDDQGDIDWQRLDDKTKLLVENIFQKLP
ncbi:MAG: hypothetical protein DCF15_15155 [Phormidesmis priestleyi]|uniref:Uncharacterized protein n=1 Tax=Phormidesmis priestleyi TaxID=268141 RepID=A0A2W4Z851_9CYAN|nr:MAG: hypothetical protein DCF15_15155 [Phormidesmis priestleyi]